MAHISSHEGPEYCGAQVRACIFSMAGGREGEAGDIAQGLLLWRFRMPFDCGIWLQLRDETGWWRMHLLLRLTFLVHPGVIHRRPPPW